MSHVRRSCSRLCYACFQGDHWKKGVHTEYGECALRCPGSSERQATRPPQTTTPPVAASLLAKLASRCSCSGPHLLGHTCWATPAAPHLARPQNHPLRTISGIQGTIFQYTWKRNLRQRSVSLKRRKRSARKGNKICTSTAKLLTTPCLRRRRNCRHHLHG